MSAPPDETKPVRKGVLEAVSTAYLGGGQAGNNVVNEFYRAGIREDRCGIINTAIPDMAKLSVPNKLHIGKSEGGARKNPAEGARIAKEHQAEIMRFCEAIIGDAELPIIPVGASGGTGAGMFPLLVECASNVIRRRPDGKINTVGAIVILPTTGEGPTARVNAHQTLSAAYDLLGKGILSPLIVVDNSKLQHAAPVTRFFNVVNTEVVKQLVRFNTVSALSDSGIQNFDRANYLDVLRSGVVNFGFSRVKLPENIHMLKEDDDFTKVVQIPAGDISDAIANTMKLHPNILQAATRGVALFVGCTKVLDHLAQDSLEKGLEDMQVAAPKALIHRGIYIDDKEPGLIVTAMIGGREGADHYFDGLR